ncbi:MAG: hypothetical protein R3E14_05345 [Erythrobacter sp.]
MIIGMLSRDIELSRVDQHLKSLFFVSMFHAKKEHADIVLRLSIEIKHRERDEVVRRGPYDKPLADDVALDEEENLVIVSLPIDKVPLDIGTQVVATLEFGDETEIYRLNINQTEELSEN